MSRTNQRIQVRISEFKKAVNMAIRQLMGIKEGHNYLSEEKDARQKIRNVVASTDWDKGWPNWLWEVEEKKVQNELLSIMDEMQRALLSCGKIEEWYVNHD